VPDAMIAERVRDLADRRDLHSVRAFLHALPPGADRGVLLLAAAGVDTGRLRTWLAEQAPTTPVRAESLEELAADAGPALAANRVLVVLRCGKLLLPDTVAAAATVLDRPAGSYAVLVVGAEDIHDAADLDLVRRGLWRVLLGEPGERWAGQDLPGHGALLWSAGPAAELAEPARDQVTGDCDRLAGWLAAVPDTDPAASTGTAAALAATRLRHALDLAERELAERAPTRRGRRTDQPDPAALRTAVADLRTRLLRRLDADLTGLELRVTASLQMLEQDLAAGVGTHLAGHSAASSPDALRASLLGYLSAGVRAWRAEVLDLVLDRVRRTGEESAGLLDAVDWRAVNAVLGTEPPGYPTLVVRRLALPAPVALPGLDRLAGPPAPGRTGAAWVPTLRRAAYGGVATAAGLVVLGPLVLPVVAAGALAGAGGALADIRLTDGRARQAALSYARAAISATMEEFQRAVREATRRATEPLRQALRAEFTVLDTALAAAGGPADGTMHPAEPDDADAAALARLRAELSTAPEEGA
jgi:hypothetical protein